MVFNLRLIFSLARRSFRWTGSKWLSCSTSVSLWLFKSSFDCNAFLRPRNKANRDIAFSLYCYWQKLTAAIIVIVSCSCFPLNIYKRLWCEEPPPIHVTSHLCILIKAPRIKSGLNKSSAPDYAASIKSPFPLDSTLQHGATPPVPPLSRPLPSTPNSGAHVVRNKQDEVEWRPW